MISSKDGLDSAIVGHDPLMRYVELRRHTDNEGDRLTPQGVADAEVIGRDGLHPPYAAYVSTGAARATQMLEILRHAAGQDEMPISSATGLRSPDEDRWRQAAKAAGKGANLDAIRAVDPRVAGRSWRATAPPTRRPGLGRPARLSRRQARAKEFC